jgi:hypothetical protein
MAQRQEVVQMQGGLDLVTPGAFMRPGALIACQNYESEVRGYRRVEGYERLDGRPSPSEASYWVLPFITGTTAISEGDTLTGATSGATGLVLQDAVADTGTWGGGDAAGDVILYNVSGTFQDGENLQVSAATVAVSDGVALEKGAETDALENTYLQAAIEKRRTAIAAMTGSGGTLGIATYKGDIYAWRNNAGGTAAVMYKATSAGWVAQSFGHTLDFTGGNVAALVEGETITGGTSGATATVERVVKQSGAWAGSAAGYLVLSGVTGTFSAAETVTGGTSTGTVAASGAQAAITLPAGGNYRTLSHNFYGTANLRRLYGVNGEGYAFEWDGSVMAPIRTGVSASIDKPKHIGVHNNHLMLAFDGGSLMHSGTGLPLSFDAADGAGETGFGEDITGLLSSTKTATIIAGRNKIGYLTGNDVNDFVLANLSEDSGAIEGTLQMIGKPHFLDDRGVRDMTAAQSFGDWEIGSITEPIEPLLASKKASGLTPVGSLRVRAKSQYRLYYSDGSGVSIYFGRQRPECMTFKLAFTPTCFASGETSTGDEILLAGDDAGFVYELDAGTSADGASVEAYVRTSFLNQGAPFREKRYHRTLISVVGGNASMDMTLSCDVSYGDPDKPISAEADAELNFSGGFWDEANWNEFYWSSAIEGQAVLPIDNVGTNVSMALMSDATYEVPHTLSSVTVNFTPRRQIR